MLNYVWFTMGVRLMITKYYTGPRGCSVSWTLKQEGHLPPKIRCMCQGLHMKPWNRDRTEVVCALRGIVFTLDIVLE
jgi:hypothetical protein